MCHRAHLEKAPETQILLGSAMKEYYFKTLFNESIQLSTPMNKILDYHIVLEFKKDETWGNLTSPRTNRFYLNYDYNNTFLDYMNDFHEKEKKFKSDIMVLGGL